MLCRDYTDDEWQAADDEANERGDGSTAEDILGEWEDREGDARAEARESARYFGL